MAVFKFAVLALLLICFLHSIKAMGLCDFADKFPCKDNEGSVCFKNPGCKGRNPRQGQTTQHNTQRTTQQKQVTTEHATSEVSTRPKTTDNLITTQLTTQQKQVTTEHAASEVSTRPKTFDILITSTPLCPPNMVYGNCSTCQRTCRDPKDCITNCTEPEICICADGFLLKGDDCVPEEECGCFIEGEGILHDGGFYVNVDCTRRGVCNNGQLVWDDTYKCSSTEICEERNDGRQCYSNATDCLDIYNTGVTDSGIYTISPINWPGSPFQVYCNMTDGGGWTSFQRRVDGSVEFYRNWTSYKEGFGSPGHEFWLGNEKLYYLTNQKRYTLRIDLVNRFGSPYFAKFDLFKINDEDDNYRLSQIGSYNGTAGDSLTWHLNGQLSTYDDDNDAYSGNCAGYLHGAWWYRNCGYSDLNGDYHADICDYGDIYWSTLPFEGSQSHCDVQFTEMKVRPV